jgi:hypothetical protein
MALEVDYLPVATATGANVDPQANFDGSSYQENGFTQGIATSAQANKILRQTSMFSAALANVISNILQIAVLDDGDLATLITHLTNMIPAAASAGSLTQNTAAPGTSTTAVATTAFVAAAIAAVPSGFVSLTDESLQTMAGPLAAPSLASSGNISATGGATIGGAVSATNGTFSGTVSGTNITTLTGDVATAQGNISTLQGDVSTLDGEMTTAQGSISALQGQMTTADGNIATLMTAATVAVYSAAQRVLSTVYTNSSSVRLAVYATYYTTGSYGQGFQMNGFLIPPGGGAYAVKWAGCYDSAGQATVDFRVPPGWSYYVAINNSNTPSNPQTPNFYSWYEILNG